MIQAYAKLSQITTQDAINARRLTSDRLDELAASIKAKGLISPLVVRLADAGAARGKERYEVIDGRRRWQALQRLAKAKTIPRDHPVPVIVRTEDETAALETSLIANTVRLPMHPVDQYEVMSRISAQGVTEDELAARFGLSGRTVRQQLALGRLAPEVRAAWREGKIDARIAQAFALNPDHAVQAETLRRLSQQRMLTEWSVRRELATERVRADQSAELAFVGEAAYRAAGGRISDDLFEDHRYVEDVTLLHKLARERLAADCDRLRAAGWAWAELSEDASFSQWMCDHVRGEDGSTTTPPEEYSDDERRRAGCLVGIDDNGTLDIVTGLVRPAPDDGQRDLEEAIAEAAAGTEAKPDEQDDDDACHAAAAATADDPYAISQALSASIHETLTLAAADTLEAHPDVALRALVATLLAAPDARGPIQITDHGHAAVSDRHQRTHSFASALATQDGADVERLVATLARRVAQALSMVPELPRVCQVLVAPRRDAIDTLRDALPGATYLAAVRQRFNAADYFQRAPKSVAIAALAEMEAAGVSDAHIAGGAAFAKKAALATRAAELARQHGWLPPALRHPEYALIAARAIEDRHPEAPQPRRMRGGHPEAPQT
jgi:ParB family chromosome partitioning protein